MGLPGPGLKALFPSRAFFQGQAEVLDASCVAHVGTGHDLRNLMVSLAGLDQFRQLVDVAAVPLGDAPVAKLCRSVDAGLLLSAVVAGLVSGAHAAFHVDAGKERDGVDDSGDAHRVLELHVALDVQAAGCRALLELPDGVFDDALRPVGVPVEQPLNSNLRLAELDIVTACVVLLVVRGNELCEKIVARCHCVQNEEAQRSAGLCTRRGASREVSTGFGCTYGTPLIRYLLIRAEARCGRYELREAGAQVANVIKARAQRVRSISGVVYLFAGVPRAFWMAYYRRRYSRRIRYGVRRPRIYRRRY